MRVPLFHERHGFPPPHRGPLVGRSVLVVVSPTECDARAVRSLRRQLRPLGVRVGVSSECHGEARGEDRSPLYPDCLLVSVNPDAWDALVFAGGRGAVRVAGDLQARDLLRRFAAQHKSVSALGEGRRVLAAAGLDGFVSDDPRALADYLAAGWRKS